MLLATLGPPIVILATVLTGIFMIVKALEEGKKLDARHRLTTTPQELLEESIDDTIARYRQARRTRRAREKSEWDERYLLTLPVEEHPDYFELDLASDQVDEIVQMTASGEICASYKSRRNSRGVSYSLELDHITKTAQVSTGKISWEVPLSRVDKWKELA